MCTALEVGVVVDVASTEYDGCCFGWRVCLPMRARLPELENGSEGMTRLRLSQLRLGTEYAKEWKACELTRRRRIECASGNDQCASMLGGEQLSSVR